MPLPQYSGTWDIKQAAHLLRRATFGATKDQIDSFVNDYASPGQAVDALFREPNLPPPVLPIDPQTGQEWVEAGITDANSKEFDLETFTLKWILGQSMSPGVPEELSLAYAAREKVVHFLHTHFTTIASKVSSSRALYFQNKLFRLFALDALDPRPEINFKKLTVKISVDNAMLRLLDGNLNVKGSINENYGRELIELYTIGKGLQGTQTQPTDEYDYFYYKEQDVQAAANVLTGWTDDDTFSNTDLETLIPRGKVRGTPTNASSHETDDDPDEIKKQFSTRFVSALFPDLIIRPDAALLALNGGQPSEETALDEIDKLIELIYEQEETRKHICRKIYRFYVASMHTTEDSVAIEPIINAMANTFRDSGYKLQAVIEDLLKSQHFFDSVDATVVNDNFGGLIKSPLDLTVGVLRFFGKQIPDMATSPQGFYDATGVILEAIRNQGMSYYEPTDVAGYEAYHQWPIYHRAWITPNTLPTRYKFIPTITNFSGDSIFKEDLRQYVEDKMPPAIASNARLLIVELAKYLLPLADNTLDFNADNGSLTAARLNYFLTRFVQDFAADPEQYWTDRWNGTIPASYDDIRDQLGYLFNAMLQSPEYQLA